MLMMPTASHPHSQQKQANNHQTRAKAQRSWEEERRERCNLSITFVMVLHTLLNGTGKGKSFFEIFEEFTWHILSYAKIVDCIALEM